MAEISGLSLVYACLAAHQFSYYVSFFWSIIPPYTVNLGEYPWLYRCSFVYHLSKNACFAPFEQLRGSAFRCLAVCAGKICPGKSVGEFALVEVEFEKNSRDQSCSVLCGMSIGTITRLEIDFYGLHPGWWQISEFHKGV